MAFKSNNVQVYEENLPDVFPEALAIYGSRAVASTKREELTGLAKKIWEDETEKHPIHSIALTDVRELTVNTEKVFYGVAQAYKLDHSTR